MNLKGMKHVRTGRNVKGLRSCPQATGVSPAPHDAARLAREGGSARWNDPVFQWVCRDVLNTETAKVTRGGESVMPQKVDEAIRKVCAT